MALIAIFPLILINPTWVTELIANYGWIGLLTGSFLSATMLPFSSELMLQLWIYSGQALWAGFFAASVGNCLGVSANYLIGKWARTLTTHSEAVRSAVNKSEPWFDRYGTWTLVLSVLPVIGDPVTLAAGYFNIRIQTFILIVFGLRIFRYLVIIWLNGWFFT
ncbi:MAG: DedA family protein [Bacteroidetes bacterium]|nr:DedA family protein [Bacteroidota bacterium]